MDNQIHECVTCPNGHDNATESLECSECGLPLISWEMELESLLERLTGKASFVVPHIGGSFVGIGTAGGQIVTNLCNFFGEDMTGVSFLNVDSMASSGSETLNEVSARGVRFYQHEIGDTSIGGSIYCGLGEQSALQDDQLESYLHMSGIRSDDTSQVVFVTTALGGGTGSGIGPTIINLCKLCNRDVSTLVVAITPSASEGNQAHLNAFYGVSRLLVFEKTVNADMVLLLNYDKLRHIRGVGRSGKEFKSDEVVSHLLRLFQLNIYRSGIIRMCRLSKGAKIQTFVPCVAIGRSIEIFGNLANVLESAAAYPLADIDFNSVLSAYLLLRIPRAITDQFPDETVTEEFERWNAKYTPNVRSSLVQVLHTDERSDRIDVCILLGGVNTGEIIKSTVSGYRQFKASISDPAQWEEYGLSDRGISEAEQALQKYDRSMDQLRQSKEAEA